MTAPVRTAVAAPAIDLTACDAEPIHLGGMIQSIGFLIVVSSDWLVARASANAAQFLGVPAATLLGAPLDAILCAEAVHTIRNRLSMVLGETSVERAFGIRLRDGGRLFDLALHFVGTAIVVEAEPSEPIGTLNAGLLVRSMVERLHLPQNLADFTRETARQVRALTGFDRVMVYRFHADGTGEVVAESLSARVASFMGLRFPASDIPAQARALYVRNLLRLIVDVDAADVPVEPALDGAGRSVDLTMSVLRAVAPVHLQYLRNMGVRASMSVSIVEDGRLWGLIACHHMEARHVGFERRTTLELFVQMFSLLLERRQRGDLAEQVDRARLLHGQVLGAMANKASNAENIAGLTKRFGELIPHDGVGIWTEGETILTGSTPAADEFATLIDLLNREPANRIYATVDITRLYPAGRGFADRAAGLLAIPISRTPRDYLVFFRREIAASVVWAGNPKKAVTTAGDGERLSPRSSFAAWREIVRGQSSPWTRGELAAADELRVALLEVILRHVDSSVEGRRDVAARQDVLIAELNHRVRNILGLVKGLVARSGASDAQNVEAFREMLGARVQSLARAHDQITARNWEPVPLSRLVATEAEPYADRRTGCVVAAGPGILLHPRAFTTVALLVHELMTNSAKYGAIGSAEGVTNIDWSLEGGDCVITWRERNGPPVTPPTRRGFGSTIIERSIGHDLGGEARIEYAPEGVTARFVVPAVFISVGDGDPGDAVAVSPVVGAAPRIGGVVLLVEDNMIIALDAEAILVSLGASRVDVARDTADAMRHIDHEPPAAALLDVNIGDGTSYAIAARLTALGIPIIFATGYGTAFSRPPGCAAAPVVAKPYTAAAIGHAFHVIAGGATFLGGASAIA